MSTLTKDRIVEALHSKGYQMKDGKALVELLLEEIKQTLEGGEEVKIAGFGRWNIRHKKPRIGRNPHTGEKIEISERRVVTFHVSDRFKTRFIGPDAGDLKKLSEGKNET